ncbi:MAG: type IVB secretion system protein DotA [Gammaproteobacteria bacterium]
MKIKQKLIYLFSIFAILFAPLSAMAFDVNSITSAEIFTPPAADKSITFLSQLFGSVGGVLQGSSGQLLGELLGVLNYGVVLLASSIMVYTVILSVINTAQEGEFMGRGMKSAWIVVRSVAGLGLLVPQATGYSLAQVIVMWAVVQGVGLADKAWERSLNYLADRGGVYTAPIQEDSMYKTLGSAGQIFQSQVCAYRLENVVQGLRKNKLEEYRKSPVASPELRDALAKPSPQFGYFTDLNAKTISFGFRTIDNKQNKNSVTEGICGVYSWESAANVVKGSSDDANVNAIKMRYQNYAKAGLDQMIMDLMPAAKRVAEKLSDNTVDQSIGALVQATLDYENIMTPTVADDQQQALQKRNKDIQKAKDDGWIVAGSYYRMIADFGIGKSGSKYQPDMPNKGILTFIGSNQKEVENKLKEAGIGDIVISEDASFLPKLAESLSQGVMMARFYLGSKVVPGQPTAAVTTAYKKLADLYESNSNEIGGGKNTRVMDAQALDKDMQKNWKSKINDSTRQLSATSWVGGILVGAMSTAVFDTLRLVAHDDWMEMVNNTERDGISKIQRMGRQMINRAIGLWTVGLTIPAIPTMVANGVAIGAAPFSAMGASVGVGLAAIASLEAIQVGVKAISPLLNMVASALFTNGMVLSVYIPLIPFLVFTFAAIGWLISVLEAMVAAPLVALGITHPEGHDLMGKAEQATMLLLSVFLRPILMIIGFMAAILLSWVAIKVVNLGFGYTIERNGILRDGLFAITEIIGVLVAYTVIMITVLNTCFSLIHVIPQKVMNWIGLHPEASNVEGMLHEAKGAVHGAGQAVGQGGGQLLDGAGSEGAAQRGVKSYTKQKNAKAKKEGNGAATLTKDS